MKIKQLTNNNTINLALDTIELKKQALIFVNTKRSAEKTAEDISKKLQTTPELSELAEKILNVVSKPTKQCLRLAKCVKKGTAFHHAGLASKQRELIEDNFRSGVIKIIASTPTLAAGLDLPAYRAIIKDVKRFTARGMDFIPVLEYLQMAGRAGRPKYDTEGQAICIANEAFAAKEITNRYLNGYPEDIYSKLAVEPVLRTYVLSLIASRIVNTEKEIIGFFEKTFWAHQFKDMDHIQMLLDKVLNLLEGYEFIKSSSQSEFRTASDMMEEVTYTATALGKRVAELYLDPLTANHLCNGIREASSIMLHPISFLQLVSHTLEMRPLLKTKVKEYDEIQELIFKFQDHFLEKEPSVYEPEYDTFVNSVKTASFLHDWVEEKDEEYILEKFDVRPGEIHVKLNIADWLLYSCEELARIMQFQPMLKEIKKMRVRIKNGAKEELIPLLRLKDIGRIRARKLYNNKVRDIAGIKKVDINVLAKLVGKKTAMSIKDQVGEEVNPDKIIVSERKRKGQMSLNKFN